MITAILIILLTFSTVAVSRADDWRGMVASAHPVATEAGLRVLKQGGNAVDAAVAVALTLGVVDSDNSGIGGGCFLLIHRADGSLVALDGRETAPAAATSGMFVRQGKADIRLSQTGALASGVPGALAAYEFAADCANLSHRFKRTVALFITSHCVKAFVHGQNAPSAEAIAQELEIPIRLVRSTIFELMEARILAEVRVDHNEAVAYQPGRPLEHLTVTKILGALDRHGADTLPLAESPSLDKLRETVRKFDEILETASANLKIQDL